jgi:hypothetical protein
LKTRKEKDSTIPVELRKKIIMENVTWMVICFTTVILESRGIWSLSTSENVNSIETYNITFVCNSIENCEILILLQTISWHSEQVKFRWFSTTSYTATSLLYPSIMVHDIHFLFEIMWI